MDVSINESEASVLLAGLGIGSYRSFRERQRLALGRINLLAGPNNSGKSNVLRFLHEQLPALATSYTERRGYEVGFHDQCRGSSQTDRIDLDVAAAVGLDGSELQVVPRSDALSAKALLRRALIGSDLVDGDGLVWFSLVARREGVEFRAEWVHSIVQSASEETKRLWSQAWSQLTGQTRGSFREHWLPETLTALCPLRHLSEKAILVPAIRQVNADQGSLQANGAGLIHELARCQVPAVDRQADRLRFDRVQQFLRYVLNDGRAELSVPFERNTINVRMNDRLLRLEDLGTGVHEVVVLAAAATLNEDRVICLEEPEIHLHPSLQRKLLAYLAQETANQYFVATHSAHILDTPGADVFHVALDEGYSRVSKVLTSHDQFDVCHDLGYRASDLLQSNSIIWVEGPSDRIYLLHWLHVADPTLRDGVDFSIMFYGGRLLSHLTADDPEIEEFISLRRLNRNLAIVIDSDRDTADSPINATKERIVREFGTGPGMAWVTAGREIENYLVAEVAMAALKKTHKSLHGEWSGRPFDCVFPKGAPIDKIRFAHSAVQEGESLDVLDLHERIDALVRFIHAASGRGMASVL